MYFVIDLLSKRMQSHSSHTHTMRKCTHARARFLCRHEIQRGEGDVARKLTRDVQQIRSRNQKKETKGGEGEFDEILIEIQSTRGVAHGGKKGQTEADLPSKKYA